VKEEVTKHCENVEFPSSVYAQLYFSWLLVYQLSMKSHKLYIKIVVLEMIYKSLSVRNFLIRALSSFFMPLKLAGIY